MAKFYGRSVEHASRTKSIRAILLMCLLLTFVDLLSMFLLIVPCIRSLYARQNNVDYNLYLQQTQITVLQQQNAALEKELRLLKQDIVIVENVTQGKDYIPAKE